MLCNVFFFFMDWASHLSPTVELKLAYSGFPTEAIDQTRPSSRVAASGCLHCFQLAEAIFCLKACLCMYTLWKYIPLIPVAFHWCSLFMPLFGYVLSDSH